MTYATPTDIEAFNARSRAYRFIYRPLFVVFFALVLCLPFLWVEAKLLVGLVLIALSLAFNRQVQILQSYYLIALALVGIYTAYVLIPIAFNTAEPGSPVYTVSLYVVFTAFWLLFLPSMSGREIRSLASIAAASAWIVLIYALAIMASGLGFLPFKVVDIYSTVTHTGVDTDNIGLASSTLSALLFSAPILTYIYMTKPTFLRVVSLGMFWLGILILGRRSALLGLMIASILVLLAATHSAKKFAKMVVLLIALAMTGSVMVAFDVAGIQTVLAKRVDQFDLFNEPERIGQTLALLDDFKERPMFGHGLGSATSVTRSEDKPWRYEMSVPAALFRYGVVGYGILFALIGIPLLYCLRQFRKAELHVQALICGACAQFVAYLVNPVFDAFDTAFQFFLPVFLASLLASNRSQKPSSGAPLH